MGYASRSGRAITNPHAPRAFGVCDRCGIWYNLHRLGYQYEWQGTKLINTRKRVCQLCKDRPNPQMKARLAPPDPVPVYDPRPENFIASRFDPTPISGNPLATEGRPRPPMSRAIMTDPPPGGPITIE
jgi:hypothetical protein